MKSRFFPTFPNDQTRARQSGNVFFFIMLGLVLFAALSFTVVESTKQTDNTLLSENEAKLSKGQIESFGADIRAGKTTLQLAGCDTIDYTPPADQGVGDKSCHMYHPDGAGVTYRDFGLGAGCDLESMSIGENCNNLIYAGESSGNRIYTTVADQGQYMWANWHPTTSTSSTDGLSNTDTLVGLSDAGAPYEAAQACRSLGNEWYLPASEELDILYENLVDQNGDNTPGGPLSATYGFNTSSSFPDGWYWSSTESNFRGAISQSFNDGSQNGAQNKLDTLNVRCVRR